jgi:hypothetical protein
VQRVPLALLLLWASSVLPAQIRGGAPAPPRPPAILTWGTTLQRWPLDGGAPQTLATGRDFRAGCVDEAGGAYLLERGRLLYRSVSGAHEEVIEPATEFQECLTGTFESRRGVFFLHHYAQLRFAWRETGAWRYEEVYSIYTPSQQGGLLRHDVDGDGCADLLLGNYWARNPCRPSEPWHVFTINMFFYTPQAARARLALAPGNRLYWGAAAGEPRLVLHTPKADIREQWSTEPLPDPPAGLTALLVHGDRLLAASPAGLDVYEKHRGAWHKTRLLSGAVVALIANQGVVWAVTPTSVRAVLR